MSTKDEQKLDRLFWLDMEMTGLDVEKEVVIEVAAIVTDMQFNEKDSYQAVVKQPQKYLDAMDDWNQRHHRASGLLELIPKGKTPDEVERDLIELLDIHFGKERAVLAGNSIGQDRLFIDKYFKKFSARLHYRMLDVTSWKLVFNNLYDIKHNKEGKHRALDDIRESMAEMQTYLSHVKVNK